MQTWFVIGLMSGTSLDGIDVAACEFGLKDNKWSFKIHHAMTYNYSEEWIKKLSTLPSGDALTFARVHTEYGHLLGRTVRDFSRNTGFKADFISSHGHTIFHQPASGLTVQIGAGSAIAVESGLPAVCDFRTADVALGGQGAPLVPVGDRLLFGDYDACLNLGGFANISMETDGGRIAFDICPANIVLNYLADMVGLRYDQNGEIAAGGHVDQALLNKLNGLDYYTSAHPKSLGREWLEMKFLPLLQFSGLAVENKLRTVCEHVARQVNDAVGKDHGKKVLVTGGGAWNGFLMDAIRKPGRHEYTIPEPEWVNYKEALIFALLGVLRWQGEINILKTVTGCRHDHSGGAIWNPIPRPLQSVDASPSESSPAGQRQKPLP